MSNSITSNKFRFALVGAGIIGTHRGKVTSELADQIQLVAVADHTLEKAEKIEAERGGKALTHLTDAQTATDVDVVVVCTPTGAHEVAIEALVAGKHVIIENQSISISPGGIPTGSAASTSRIVFLTISIPQLEPE